MYSYKNNKPLSVETQIYSMEQQIKIINTILGSLCSIELSKGGRSYLNKLKERIERDLMALKQLEKVRTRSQSTVLNSVVPEQPNIS